MGLGAVDTRQNPLPTVLSPLGNSPAISQVRRLISQVANHNTVVLIQGESGSGKEVVARALHQNSERAKCAFVPVNCGAIPADLLESELFGHEKGAFTGAINTRPGLIEAAEDGTLFLDEIGELPLTLQAKLLNVLERRVVRRIGSTKERAVPARFVAATNRDLHEMSLQGKFRQDLYYRLSTIPVLIPPLRDRPEDIAVLALRFAMRTAAELGKKIDGISPDALESMQQYPWPGNIRELQHVIERAVILSPDPMIHAHCLEGTRFGLAHSLGAPSIRPRSIPTPGAVPAVATSTTPAGGMAIGGGALPKVRLVDMSRLPKGPEGGSAVSPPLVAALPELVNRAQMMAEPCSN